eukprot:4334120-Alexandrium_andersonii.AAC.1
MSRSPLRIHYRAGALTPVGAAMPEATPLNLRIPFDLPDDRAQSYMADSSKPAPARAGGEGHGAP